MKLPMRLVEHPLVRIQLQFGTKKKQRLKHNTNNKSLKLMLIMLKLKLEDRSLKLILHRLLKHTNTQSPSLKQPHFKNNKKQRLLRLKLRHISLKKDKKLKPQRKPIVNKY